VAASWFYECLSKRAASAARSNWHGRPLAGVEVFPSPSGCIFPEFGGCASLASRRIMITSTTCDYSRVLAARRHLGSKRQRAERTFETGLAGSACPSLPRVLRNHPLQPPELLTLPSPHVPRIAQIRQHNHECLVCVVHV